MLSIVERAVEHSVKLKWSSDKKCIGNNLLETKTDVGNISCSWL